MIAFGVLVVVSAFQAAHLPFFGLGISVIALGVAIALRALGVSQRRVFTGVGLLLVIYWLVPHSFLKSLKPDFTENMSGFFLAAPFTPYSRLTPGWRPTPPVSLSTPP